jgi:hypothetical protein
MKGRVTPLTKETTMSIRGAELFVRHLKAQGVRHVFGVPDATCASR